MIICMVYGEGVSQDIKEAIRFYKLAAEQGYADAQHNLGFCYREGEWTAKTLFAQRG